MTARVVAEGDAFTLYDGADALTTPAGRRMTLPSDALAQLVAAQDLPRRLAATALDRLADNPQPAIADFVSVGANDLLCYRADEPPALAERQEAQWSPLLDWARSRFKLSFETTRDLAPVKQSEATRQRLGELVRGDSFRLAGLAHGAATLGSAVLALALAERHITAEAAHELAHLDTLFQIETWGEDDEARARLEAIAQEIGHLAAYFFALHENSAYE